MMKIFTLSVSVLTSLALNAQGTWNQKTSLPATARYYPASFSIGNYGYLITGGNGGSTFFQDLWQWDQTANSWTQMANLPGSGRCGASAFAIGAKGYIGTGWNGSNYLNDFWEYDQATNSWTQKTSFPGTARYVGTGFSNGSKGYMGLGLSGGWVYYNDLWEYDPASNAWTAKSNFPTVRDVPVSFTIGTKGYVGTGYDNSSLYKDFWEWDPATNIWTQKANFGGAARANSSGFSANGKGYIGLGSNISASIYYQDFWEWNPGSNTWTQVADFGAGGRRQATGFSVGSNGYVSCGQGPASVFNNDLWEFSTCTPPPFTMSHTDVTTYGGLDGSATVTVTGGIPPFTYAWNTFPIQTTTTISNLSAGNYFITVTDGVGCSATKNEVVSQPQALSATVTPVNVTCYGSNNGTATGAVSGGTPPYSYSWSTIPVQTTQTASGLFPGTYTLTGSDAIGGSCTKAFSISQPTLLTAQTTVVKANCGVSNGKITGSASGGTGPYSYSWSNGGTTQIISNILSGNYTLTVTDNKGCTAIDTANVGIIPATINIAFTANPQAGTAPLAVAFANNTPSISNYNFTWNWGDGSDSVNYNNPTVFHIYQYNGYYDVSLTATDKVNGCTDTLLQLQYIYAFGGTSCTHTVDITPAGPLTKCQGDTVLLTASTNATSPFTYQWNVNSIAISGANSSNLAVTQSGYYSVTAIEANCPKTSSAVQVNFTTAPAQPTISSAGSIVPCVGGSQTLTSSIISGGTYLWSTGATTQDIVVTTSGSYWVSTINAVGCSSTSAPFTVNASLSQISICMVTVDSSSTKNVVIWEKPASSAIDSFRIYREIASVFTHVGSVPYSSYSTFTDNTTGVNPKTTSYKYKLSLRDICGNESLLSSYHRTIHLSVSPATPCGYNLFWNDYAGFSIPQYRVWRDSAHAGWEVIDSVSFGNTSWTDITCYPAGDTVDYMVEVVHPTGCNPSIKNPQVMQAIPSTRSNKFTVGTTVTSSADPVSALHLIIYPNPSAGKFTVTTSGKDISTVEIYNMMGEKVYSISNVKSSNTKEINISSQPDGVYFISLRSRNEIATQKIVIAR
ncbi:MAG: T9SS type A sorting domain-containing protein [Bacteroidetes bacterium]|nr:MAG: T9SS type A sorting domain-containing protein [Bacteroidota bacterium]